jgi:hypothetical protein
MDEERGIREHNPTLYETLLESPLFATMFQVNPESKCDVSVFLADPSRGYLAFPRYTARKGDTDRVISEILRQN